MSKEELISIREYARRKKCSDTTIHKAIKSEKIVKGVVKVGGKPKILESVADKEWGMNFNPAYSTAPGRNPHLNNQMLPEVDRTEGRQMINTGLPTDDTEVITSAPRTVNGKKSLADLKRDKAEVDLATSLIVLKERKGQLVDKDKVYKALFLAGQEVRTMFQSIPDRIIDDILSAKSRSEAHGVLFESISEALDTLSKVIERDIVT